jgi:hypothetical protein
LYALLSFSLDVDGKVVRSWALPIVYALHVGAAQRPGDRRSQAGVAGQRKKDSRNHPDDTFAPEGKR